MSMRTLHRMAVLASAAALASGISLAAPSAALATPRPAGEPNVCAVGWYCLFLGSNLTGVVAAEGDAKITNQPLGLTIDSVENNTLYTLVLQDGRNTRVFLPNTRTTTSFSFDTVTYTLR